MTEPTITDEELAHWEAAGVVHARENHMRLISTLRATQEENAQLRDALGDIERRLCPCPEHEQQSAQAKDDQITNLKASLNARNAEVQALKEKLGPV